MDVMANSVFQEIKVIKAYQDFPEILVHVELLDWLDDKVKREIVEHLVYKVSYCIEIYSKVSKNEYSFKVNLDAMGFLVHLARRENPATLEKR